MGLQDFGTMDANASLKQVVNELANLMDTLNFLLNGNLDVKNIRAESLTAKVIKANSITADKMDVTELSAITANMGTITAGSITTNAEINVGTNATVGTDLFVGNLSPSSNSIIVLNGAILQSTAGSNNLSMSANNQITLSCGNDLFISSFSGKVNISAPNGFWVNGVLIAP